MDNGINDEKPQQLPDNVSIGLMFDPMEQMRELLFGATKRETERQFNILEAKLEETRREFLTRFEELDSRILELSQETEKNRLETIEAIGGAIVELGYIIKAMSEKRKA